MGVFSEIVMEQQNSMFDSSAAFEDDEAFELEEMESLPVPPVGTDTVPVSAASVSAGETASADAEEEPVDEVASDGEEKSAEEGNSAQPPAAEDEEKKRAEHEAAEAQRKAEFDAKQQAKKAAEQEQIARLEAMSDEEVIAASTQRVSTDVEKLTRRNMKECVSEHIQMLCMEDTAFARLTMHPKKNMIRCFQYINRKAYTAPILRGCGCHKTVCLLLPLLRCIETAGVGSGRLLWHSLFQTIWYQYSYENDLREFSFCILLVYSCCIF